MPCRFFRYARFHLLSCKFCMLLTFKTNYPTYPTGVLVRGGGGHDVFRVKSYPHGAATLLVPLLL